jgi:hypothetical protein
MPLLQPTATLGSFGVQGHAYQCSVEPALAPLIRFDIAPDTTGGVITVYWTQPAVVLGSVSIAEASDGSRTTVVFLHHPRGAVALALRYAASYLLAQPSPFRAAMLHNWLHVYQPDAWELLIAQQRFADELRAARRQRASFPAEGDRVP